MTQCVSEWPHHRMLATYVSVYLRRPLRLHEMADNMQLLL